MNNHNMNANQANHSNESQGKLKVQFRGQHNPITGIGYRFRFFNDELIEGKTDKKGYTKTIIAKSEKLGEDSELVSYIKLESNVLSILLEVQRDDGTWKNIGGFNLEAGKEKEITAQIETIALPFKLVLKQGL